MDMPITDGNCNTSNTAYDPIQFLLASLQSIRRKSCLYIRAVLVFEVALELPQGARRTGESAMLGRNSRMLLTSRILHWPANESARASLAG